MLSGDPFPLSHFPALYFTSQYLRVHKVESTGNCKSTQLRTYTSHHHTHTNVLGFFFLPAIM